METNRQQAIVGEGGRIEIFSPELPIGTQVEIIILIDEQTQPLSPTRLTANPLIQKPFTIRQFSLGKEIHLDRDQLYADRIVI
jgi:hypothetical protein